MASFNYQNAQKTALRLIKQFGQSVTMFRLSGGYDPVSGTSTNQLVNATNPVVVSLPASGANAEKFDNRFKEDLKKGKIRFFYVAAKDIGFAPEPGDFLVFENTVWDIAGTTPLNPGGTNVLFTIGCRTSGAYDWATFQQQLVPQIENLNVELSHFGEGNEHDFTP